jgi:pimeloyl-ACP methyl ester carboxylesterase
MTTTTTWIAARRRRLVPMLFAFGAVCATVAAATALAQTAPAASPAPLVLKSQGSFFVGGEDKTITQPGLGGAPATRGEITVNQMYVQYQIPMDGDRHVPVVMVHGCCLSSKTWETTPDGRMGWSEYFVRKDRRVYLADQVSRARSGFDPTAFANAQLGKTPAADVPAILDATHQLAWTVFRFGPKYGEAFADEQFPIAAVDELYKQMIPDLNSTLPQNPNPTWTQMAALAVQLGGAVLMGHSESGFFPEQAALIDPTGVRGIVSIEMPCETNLNASRLATLAKIPTLILFGDHLNDVPNTGPVNWSDSFSSCKTFIRQLDAAGGDAQLMHLPELGIHGNSHMLMQDENSDRIADLVIAWIDAHAEGHEDK